MADYKRNLSALGENASLLSRRAEIAQEQLDMTAELLIEELLKSEDNVSVDEVYSEFCRICENAQGRSRAIACRRIVSDARLSGQIAEKNLLGFGEAALPGTHGRIAYVRNKRNDDAFIRFSEKIRGAKAYYCSSFSEACEAVFSNACEFCILPIENSADGKLYSFYSMIDRYELIICNVVYLSADDGADKTGFALVSRGVTLKSKTQVARFEFSVVCEDGAFPDEIATVARFMGGRVLSVGTQPVPYDDVGVKYYFSMEIESSSVLPIAFYMSMEYPRYMPLGAYIVKN